MKRLKWRLKLNYYQYILDNMSGNMERLKWRLKQLFPLAYDTTFTENGQRRLCIWRMWFGRCFNVRYFDLAA